MTRNEVIEKTRERLDDLVDELTDVGGYLMDDEADLESLYDQLECQSGRIQYILDQIKPVLNR